MDAMEVLTFNAKAAGRTSGKGYTYATPRALSASTLSPDKTGKGNVRLSIVIPSKAAAKKTPGR